MNEEISQLYRELKKRRLIRKVERQSKRRKMNEGKGYSYTYIRRVLNYQHYKNTSIVKLAKQILKKDKAREEKKVVSIKKNAKLAKAS